MKTLIVEDDFVSRMILQKILQPYGECEIAVNGREALRAFDFAYNSGMPYNLICMDIMMPEMDGKTAVAEIRKKEKNLNISAMDECKIFMVTALDTPKDVVDSFYNGGCTSYIVKPIDRKKILGLLRENKLID